MKNFVFVLVMILSPVVYGEATEDSIHSIVRGNPGEPHLVKFHSGAVEFIEQGEEEKLLNFENKLTQQAPLFTPQMDNKFLLEEAPGFEPSIVADSEIPAIFKRMNQFMRRKSECSDRAHVWAWDEHKVSGINSQKAFLFLTDTYIKRNRYKWWFHVAPMYTTASGKQMVMDGQFLDRPVTFTQWKNLLVFSKRDCVTDFRFLDYNAGADQTQDCYTKAEPMYYRLPADIANSENGIFRSSWNQAEVNGARSRAFFKGNN